jgi:cytochrome c556
MLLALSFQAVTMKQIVLLLIGLVIGASGGVIVTNALRARDAYARGAMDVMQHHYGVLRESLRAQRCDAGKSTLALTQLRALSNEIEPAIYPDSTPESAFREFSTRLRDALDAGMVSAPADCAALAPVAEKIGKVCDECHQQYR